MNVSIIIPCYNSEKSLEELTARLFEVMTSLEKSFEIIYVNDFSKDKTWSVIQMLAQKYPFVKGVNLMKNFGQHSAIICGFNLCSGDYVITMDDDLQNPPEEITILLNKIENNLDLDVVIGIPQDSKKTWFRKLGSKMLNYATSKIFNKPKYLKMGSFRVLRKRIVDVLKDNKTVNPAIGSLLLNYTRKIENVEVVNSYRKHGKTGYNLKKSVHLFFNNVMNNSMFPLKLIGWIGFLSSMFSVISVFIYLFRYLFGYTHVVGWTTIVVLILFFSGLILVALSILGLYIMKIVLEVNHTPQYVVKEVCNFKLNKNENSNIRG